jgi:hypothetical protein
VVDDQLDDPVALLGTQLAHHRRPRPVRRGNRPDHRAQRRGGQFTGAALRHDRADRFGEVRAARRRQHGTERAEVVGRGVLTRRPRDRGVHQQRADGGEQHGVRRQAAMDEVPVVEFAERLGQPVGEPEQRRRRQRSGPVERGTQGGTRDETGRDPRRGPADVPADHVHDVRGRRRVLDLGAQPGPEQVVHQVFVDHRERDEPPVGAGA